MRGKKLLLIICVKYRSSILRICVCRSMLCICCPDCLTHGCSYTTSHLPWAFFPSLWSWSDLPPSYFHSNWPILAAHFSFSVSISASGGTVRSDWWDWGCEPFSLIKFVVWLWWHTIREACWQRSLQQTDWAQRQIIVKTGIRKCREHHGDVQTDAT